MCNSTPLAFFLLLFNLATAQDVSPALEKKTGKIITESWKGITVEKKAIGLSHFKLKTAGVQPDKITLNELHSANKLAGYSYLTQSMGKAEYFTYLILFNTDLSVRSTHILAYRETYGGEIGNKRWLAQFEGKINGEKMEFGKDIDGISGATISAKSITFGVRQASLVMQELKQMKVIQ